MRQIYFQARTVCIWLDHGCERDLEPIRTFISRWRLRKTVDEVIPGAQIMQSPYWRRAWTLQEHLLARDAVVLSGSAAVNYGNLESAIMLKYLSEKPEIIFPRMKLRHTRMPLSYLLIYHYELVCTDPRGCIFGLLSLVDWGTCKEEERIDTDYILTCQQLSKKLEIIGIIPEYQPRLLIETTLKERMERFASAQV